MITKRNTAANEKEMEQRRIDLVRETNSSVIVPISFDIYKKTPQEKKELAAAKHEWRSAMIFKHGNDWRKHNNP